MCFCASVSFATASGLFLIGAAAQYQAQSAPQRLLAMTPSFFALQQIAEGFVWMGLSYGYFASWYMVGAYTFLFFAFGLWPAWVPYVTLSFEGEHGRQRILRALCVIGAALAVSLISALIYFGATASLQGRHIAYALSLAQTEMLTRLLLPIYVAVTVGSLLVSSHRSLQLLGALIASALLVSFTFERMFFISIWCFFAAVISAFIFGIIILQNKAQK